jgi:hypothetical protein
MKEYNLQLRKNIVGEFPRKLIHRNRFDELDVGVAMDIIQRLLSQAVTKETEDVLREYNITRKNNPHLRSTKRVKPSEQPVPVVCAFFNMTMPWPHHSKIVTCEQCKATLVAQEAAGINAKYFCCFCVADRALEQYWSLKDSRKKK